MSFEFSNTCPDIDKAITDAKSVIDDHLDSFLDEACPLLDTNTKRDIVKRWTEELYDGLEDAFETVRSTNESMRDAANNQIEELEDEIKDLKD